MSFAPRALASMIQRNEIGWFDAALLPMIRMTSAFLRSIQWFVMHPRPYDSARAATVAECHILAWCSMATRPSERSHFW